MQSSVLRIDENKIKTSINSEEHTEDALHVLVSNIHPRFNFLYKNERVHPPHYYVNVLLSW